MRYVYGRITGMLLNDAIVGRSSSFPGWEVVGSWELPLQRGGDFFGVGLRFYFGRMDAFLSYIGDNIEKNTEINCAGKNVQNTFMCKYV